MALDLQDLMTLKSMGNESGMTPYEQVKVGYMQNKHHTSGVGIAGLVLGTVGTAAAIGSWIFGPMYGNAKANQAKEVAIAAKEQAALLNSSTQRQLDQLTNLFAAERQERINGDVTLNQTITDTVSGSLTAQQAAELSSVNSVMQQTYSDFVTGRASLNPTPVSIYAAPQPCACPGCGCNG